MIDNYIDSARTLKQSTMGPKKSEIDYLLNLGSMDSWIDEQLQIPASSWGDLYLHYESNKPDLNDHQLYVASWSEMVVEGQDILRQRIAYVLSQLFVVSTKDPALSPYGVRRYMCDYYDGLLTNAFDNLRDLLRFISTSPIMGEYLTFVNNISNETNSPDENYARELLQLFTMGPIELDLDGEPVLDTNGNVIPKYSQQDIEEISRILTGWRFWVTGSKEKYAQPMVATGEHDLGEKHIFGDIFPAGIGAEAELDALIELIATTEQTYTFIAKFFINKMITSNPSKAYVRRVGNAFRAADGDMRALIRAILTDPERLYYGSDTTVGKARDPLIVFTHGMRSLSHKRDEYWGSVNAAARLMPMASNSVFYHYQPDDAPSNERFSGLVAPEFKVYQWQNIYELGQLFRTTIVFAQYEEKDYYVDPQLRQLWVDSDDEGVIRYLNEHLFGGEMSMFAEQCYRDFLATYQNRKETRSQEFKSLILNALLSPEFTTQR